MFSTIWLFATFGVEFASYGANKFLFMKKLLLAAFVMAGIGFSAQAQQGSVLLYGNLGLETQNKHSKEGKVTAFTIAPGVGYQFNDNWTAGGEISFATAKFEDEKAMNEFKVGPFVRYSYPISNIFSIFGQLGAGYQGAKQGDYKASGAYAYVTPAISLNVKNGFGFSVAFGGIDFQTVKPKGGDAASSFGLTFGQTATIGISKNFGGKK